MDLEPMKITKNQLVIPSKPIENPVEAVDMVLYLCFFYFKPLKDSFLCCSWVFFSDFILNVKKNVNCNLKTI
jgi:hypothetical protein